MEMHKTDISTNDTDLTNNVLARKQLERIRKQLKLGNEADKKKYNLILDKIDTNKL